jgi:hypothetical protein
MQSTGWFIPLKPNEVKALFEPYAEMLRESYLDILTLLRDLLSRYSSQGYTTSYLDAQEVTHLLYESLRNIRKLLPEGMNLSTQFIRRKRRYNLSPGRQFLIIGTNMYRSSDSTNRLMEELDNEINHLITGSNQKNKVSSQAELRTLARRVEQIAVTNIKNAETLKYLYESTKGKSKDAAKGVNAFLDALLDEYELLRNPDSSRISQEPEKKVRSRVTKHSGAEKTK